MAKQRQKSKAKARAKAAAAQKAAEAAPAAEAAAEPGAESGEPAPAAEALPAAGEKRGEPDAPTPDLQATLQRRHKLSEELQAVEKQIYDLETTYLENSHPLGNALRGYEGLLTQSQASTRRTLVRQEDRLFSNSSILGTPH